MLYNRYSPKIPITGELVVRAKIFFNKNPKPRQKFLLKNSTILLENNKKYP
jgi:hypothetical protein